MILLSIPSQKNITLHHLLLDYNGTLACDGVLKNGVMSRLEKLSTLLTIHVITADTFGSVAQQCNCDFIHIEVISKTDQAKAKLNYLETLNQNHTIAMGNGRNDLLMLQEAILGFALLQEEGCDTQTLIASDAIFRDINDALDALLHPERLIATFRN